MIDFNVAFKTLAVMEDADELAAFFQSEGIKAHRANADSCAISQWMHEQTGLTAITNLQSVRAIDMNDNTIEGTYKYHTPAMRRFVEKFDNGEYPSLLVDRRL